MQRMVSQKIERTCEGCGVTKTYELVAMTEETIQELEGWRRVVREIAMDGQFVKAVIDACSSQCMVTADLQFEVKRREMQEANRNNDTINLAELQVGESVN